MKADAETIDHRVIFHHQLVQHWFRL
jgi:hypothetical protein